MGTEYITASGTYNRSQVAWVLAENTYATAGRGGGTAYGGGQAQESLKAMVVDAAVIITNIPAAVQRRLDEATAAEARGDVQKATEIYSELATNTLLISTAVTKATGTSLNVLTKDGTALTPAEAIAAGGRTESTIYNSASVGDKVTKGGVAVESNVLQKALDKSGAGGHQLVQLGQMGECL